MLTPRDMNSNGPGSSAHEGEHGEQANFQATVKGQDIAKDAVRILPLSGEEHEQLAHAFSLTTEDEREEDRSRVEVFKNQCRLSSIVESLEKAAVERRMKKLILLKVNQSRPLQTLNQQTPMEAAQSAAGRVRLDRLLLKVAEIRVQRLPLLRYLHPSLSIFAHFAPLVSIIEIKSHFD